MAKILVTGSKGTLGKYVKASFKNSSYELFATDRRSLDVTDGQLVKDFILKSKPDFPKNIDKQKLLPEIENFYKKQFWDTLRLDEIKAQDIAEEIYDTGVNMGEKTAVKIVQEACNLLNRDGKDYPELEVDGVIGKNTVNTINNHPYPKTLYNLLNFLQAERYIEICRKNRTQEVFMRGWLNTRIISKN